MDLRINTKTGENVTDAGASLHIQLPDRCWTQWRQRCAAQLCEASVRDLLQGFVAMRFNQSFKRLWHGMKVGGRYGAVPADQCMHLLESFVAIGRGRKGKAYKDWIFARTECGVRGAVEGGVSVLIRDVVREYIRREYPPAFMTSTSHRVQCADGHQVNLDELIAGESAPDEMVTAREIKAMAKDIAPTIVERMEHRERMALLARELGLSLADPSVLNVAGCGKSVLNEVYHKACKRMVHTLKDRYAGEDTAVMRQLVLVTYNEVAGLVVKQSRRNPVCECLFTLAEDS